MKMTKSEIYATGKVYTKLVNQKKRALAALDGTPDKKYIYLAICADLSYIKHCLATRSYGTRRPWMLQTLYYL